MGGEKFGKIPDWKIFTDKKCVADDKLQVAEDIVHRKNLFFEQIWS